MKILTIGNSFTENALRCLPQIFESAGEPLTIGRCTIGGCTLEQHWNHAEADAPVYGVYNTGDRTLRDMLTSEHWDAVTFQQSSGNSWRIGTFSPYLDRLAAFCRLHAPDAKLYFFETWAWRSDHRKLVSEHQISQAQMLSLIRENCCTLAKTLDMGILPVGEAFALHQIASGDKIGSLTRHDDGSSHASPLGEYIAGLVWYAVLTGGDIDRISFVPDELAEAADAAKAAAKAARIRLQNNTGDQT